MEGRRGSSSASSLSMDLPHTDSSTTTTTTTASGLVREQLRQYARLVSAFLQALLTAPTTPSSSSSTSSSAASGQKKGTHASSSSSPEEIMQQILQTDHNLLRALQHLREHQRQQQRIARLREEVEKKDQVVEQLALQLRQVQAILQRVIDDTSVKLNRSSGKERRAGAASVDVDEVVAYAHKVSYTTSAPPNWNPNLPHMRMFQPPAPLEVNILQGNYYHNTTSAPMPDFSDLTGEGPLRKAAAPELPALGPGPSLPPQPVLPSLIPLAELPPPPAVSAAGSEPQMMKQITLDLNPDEDSEEESEEDEDW